MFPKISVTYSHFVFQAIYGSELDIVEGASHMVMLEKPDQVNALIHGFLLKTLRIVGSASLRGEDDGSDRVSTLSLQSAHVI